MHIGGYDKASLGRLRKKAGDPLPIHVTENLNKLKKAQRELSQMNGYMPNVFQLSDHLGLTVDEIKDLMCKARQPTSLEIKIGENRDTALIDLLEDETQLPDMLLEQAVHQRRHP